MKNVTLLPYDPARTCQACGHDQVNTSFQRERTYVCQRVAALSPVEVERTCWYYDKEAHLHRTCCRCGYQWAEMTVNELPPRFPAEVRMAVDRRAGRT
jgi:hypothetical protein